MSYIITLTTQDGQQFNFGCEPEQTVQEAAEAAGFFLPASCNAGSCGACLGHCTQGEYRLSSYNPTLLSKNYQELGEILLCRTYPEGDLHISSSYTAAQMTSPQAEREAEIVSVEMLAERTMRLVLQLLPDSQSGLRFNFEPGQFVELKVPDLQLKRAYSIASSPNSSGRLEFLIRLQPKGQFSGYLQQIAKPGERLVLQGAFGSFGVQNPRLKPSCFVAGGAGVAPFLSILRTMAEQGEDYPTVLFFGVNTEQEIFYQQELADLQKHIPQLKVFFCVWQPSENWQGFRGTAVDALKMFLSKTQSVPDIFLCGPALLVDAATQVALDAGVNSQHIIFERFS